MKYLVLLLVLSTPSISNAQCKPDIESTDKYTNKHNTSWYDMIFSSPLLNGGTVYYVYAFNTISDTQTYFTIKLEKQIPFSQDRMAGTQYVPEKGKKIYISLKNGTPIQVTIDEIKKDSKVTSNMYITEYYLSCLLTQEEREDIKTNLSKDNIQADGIRIEFAENQTFQVDIKEKKSKKFLANFNCFFESLK